MSNDITVNTNLAAEFSKSNINYRSPNSSRLIVTDKFFETIAGVSTIPQFSVKKFTLWKDLIRSHLRTTYGLDGLISEPKELEPIQLFDETPDYFQERLHIYRRRDHALYLILDKAISTSKEVENDRLDKFISLSTRIYDDCNSADGYPGITLFASFETTIKGTHLHTRMNLVSEMISNRLASLGKEQDCYNQFARIKSSIKSLNMDLDIFLRMCLIRSMGAIKEHNTLMVALASMDTVELLKLSDEDVLARFIASAEQNRRVRSDDVALVAHESDTNPPPTKPPKCFNCGRMGHLTRDCRSKRQTPEQSSKRKQSETSAKFNKKGKRN